MEEASSKAIQDGRALSAASVGTEVAAVVRKTVNLSSPPWRRRSSKMMKGRTGQRVRLYVRDTILGNKRSKSNQYETTSLVQIEGVNTREDVAWYGGKRMAYVYKAKTKSNGTHYRCIWGKVSHPH